jgi:hypothetical protein
MARHRDSKVSESFGAHESNRLLNFSGRTLANSPSEFGCAETCAGHSSNDLESMGLPSYQHFLPSIRRHDQCPRGFDGIAALHFCFACAVGIPIDKSVAMQTAKPINGVCCLIPYLMQ